MFRVKGYGFRYVSGTFGTLDLALSAAHEWIDDFRLDYALIVNLETEEEMVSFWYGRHYDAWVVRESELNRGYCTYLWSRCLGFDPVDLYWDAGTYYAVWDYRN